PGFEFQDKDAELWTMITPADDYFSVYPSMNVVQTIARLRPGVEPATAQAEMNVIQRQVDEKYPDGAVGSRITVARLQDDLSRDVRPALFVLVGVVGFVLLIACANAASLLLGRAIERRKEIALRTALGARRGRLVRQMLTESVVIFVFGGTVGIGLAYIALRFFLASNPFRLPRVEEIRIDPLVLAFTVVLTLTTGIVFGLIPALQAPQVNVSDLLNEDARGTSSGKNSRMARGALVVVEVATSLILLVGAGLMVATLRKLASIPVGVRPEGIVTMRVALGKKNYPDAGQRLPFIDQTLQKVRGLPGVITAAFTSALPLQGVLTDKISIEGRPVPPPANVIRVGKEAVTPAFFNTIGVNLISGRDFDDNDRDSTELVTIINERMAKQLFPENLYPIGQRIRHGAASDPEDSYPWMKIVGVVSDVRQLSPDDSVTPVMYIPYRQVGGEYTDILARNMYLTVKTSVNPDNMSGQIRDQIWLLDHDLPISDVKNLTALISDSLEQPRMRAALVTTFALFALTIAAVGLYGVISQSVAQRTHE
ncbi:MAG TPA: ABC transporter permease, partial [Blastocatellia bacterium]|nr:ABC transporter permease [Blastocatellia bacterium]